MSGKSEEIGTMPAIEELNRFAEKLPPEHREELYCQVISFLKIGAMHGIFSALASTSGGNQQDAYIAYLSAKSDENKK